MSWQERTASAETRLLMMAPRGTQGTKSKNPPSLALRRVKAERALQIANLEPLNGNEICRFSKLRKKELAELFFIDLSVINNFLTAQL
jgi:hypothetical protein